MAVTLNNANVLVTGGSGFVGSHLIEELSKSNNRIITTIHNTDFRSYFYTQNLQRKVVLLNSDIRDFKKLFDIITKYQVDFIFHLAAQPIVGTAVVNPLETISTNILGTANILECARLAGGVKGIIAASSDKAYGNLDKKAYLETDPLQGEGPYEASKSAADLLCLSYYKTYNLPVVVTRFGNIYGEGDLHFTRLIPDVLRSIILQKKLKVRSSGKFIRDYLYVKDVVAGYLELARLIQKTAGNAYNFGSYETLSVLEVLEIVQNVLNKKLEYDVLNTAKNEIPYQSLNFIKVKKAVGWKPRYRLKNTLPEIYKWYEEYFNV